MNEVYLQINVYWSVCWQHTLLTTLLDINSTLYFFLDMFTWMIFRQMILVRDSLWNQDTHLWWLRPNRKWCSMKPIAISSNLSVTISLFSLSRFIGCYFLLYYCFYCLLYISSDKIPPNTPRVMVSNRHSQSQTKFLLHFEHIIYLQPQHKAWLLTLFSSTVNNFFQWSFTCCLLQMGRNGSFCDLRKCLCF